MAIATLDAALAGMQPPMPIAKAATPALVAGRPHSLAYLAGMPGAFAAPAVTAGGVALSSTSAMVAGQVPHTDPVSVNAYLARFSAAVSGQSGVLLLCDRLLQVGGNSGGTALSTTLLTAQTINSNALPARDNFGAINGDGVMWGLEVVSVTGAGAGNAPTLSYTNQAGTASHTAALIDAYVAASAAGAFYRFNVQAGDTGIKSVQSLTNSATMTSGTIALVAYRILAQLELVGAGIGKSGDALTLGFPRIFNGSVPFFIFIPSTTTAVALSAVYTETQG